MQRILKLKVAGEDVRKWQEFLKSQGFDGGTTGEFSEATKQATIDFQNASGLKDDGVVGNKTLTKAMALGFKPLPEVDAKLKTANTVDEKFSEAVKVGMAPIMGVNCLLMIIGMSLNSRTNAF